MDEVIERLNETVRKLEVSIVEMDACIEYLGKAENSIGELRIALHAQPNMN